MTAQVVITRQNGSTPALGGLFTGLSFFLLQRLPMRSHFLGLIQSNGGRVVKLESQAEHIIADHTRPDCPPGSISYTFLEDAIRTGALPNPVDHAARVPTGVAREAGSGAPAKATRTPFTAEDDRVLWNWVKRCGGPVKGNEIYKQLEAENARHTWQAWRDRYVKRLAMRPPERVEVTVPANPPPTPPPAPDEQVEIQAQLDGTEGDVEMRQGPAGQVMVEQGSDEEAEEDEFTEEDADLLLKQAEDIENIDDEQEMQAWSAWAKDHDDHSAEDWQRFWEEEVRPIYLKRVKDEAACSEGETNPVAAAPSSSQKRKRPAFVSPPKEAHGRKKRKSASDEISRQSQSDEEDESMPKTSDQPVPTSELNRQAQMQLRRDAGLSSEQPLPTSESNRQAQTILRQESGGSSENILPELPAQETVEDPRAKAQAQFDEEVLGIARASQPAPTLHMSNLPTSDVNRAANQQLAQESLEQEGEDDAEQDESSELKSVSVSSGDDDVEDDSAQIQEDNAAPDNVNEIASAPLTEANLASQQAQQKAPLLRGADLPQDNEAQDGDQQDEFVRYLQGVTGRPAGTQPMPAITYESQASVAIKAQLPQDGNGNDALSLYSAALEDLEGSHLPSQQEINEVMDDMIQWPSSPVASQRKEMAESQSQSLDMETQVPYLMLPSQRSRISPLEQEQMFSSQPSMVPEVSYPTLPQQGEESLRKSQPTSQRQRDANDDDVVTSEESISSQQNSEEQENGEFDFAIPAPLGGWSSSPQQTHSSQATPIASMQVRIKQELQQSENSPPRSQVVTSHQVVEVSSTSSSSSSSSEEEDAEAAPSTPTAPARRKALETQDILDAETQQPDFDLPLPPDSPKASSSVSNPSSPPPPNAAESQPALADDGDDDDDVDTYIAKKTTIHGYTEASIKAALMCTSMRPKLADLVLLDEKLGRGLPEVPGVWSEEEDKMLESGNARALRRLEEKHTWPEMQIRMQHLEDWREDE